MLNMLAETVYILIWSQILQANKVIWLTALLHYREAHSLWLHK